MLDIHSDLTLQAAVFGTHVEILETDELAALRRRLRTRRSGAGWRTLTPRLMCKAADPSPEDCFFSNALMELKPGKAEGDMPSVPSRLHQRSSLVNAQPNWANQSESVSESYRVPEAARAHPCGWMRSCLPRRAILHCLSHNPTPISASLPPLGEQGSWKRFVATLYFDC